jgi:hypothetical protein
MSMNEKWTRRDFLRIGAASALVGGVSLLVLRPRGKKCENAWDCASCALDPKKDEGCPKYGEDVVDQDASAGELPSAGGDIGGTVNKEDSHA